MKYKYRQQLPPSVRECLTPNAQELYRRAYNEAYKKYRLPQSRATSRDQVAHYCAWQKIRKQYRRMPDGTWQPKEQPHLITH